LIYLATHFDQAGFFGMPGFLLRAALPPQTARAESLIL
jgi:hypothetical protein